MSNITLENECLAQIINTAENLWQDGVTKHKKDTTYNWDQSAKHK